MWKVFKTNWLRFDISNPLTTTIWYFMALEIGESGQFQRDFAVTKIVTVLIFAIFCTSGVVRG